ncbi:MAG: hypothetical protein ABL921_07565 [Pirellula sp.]
MLGICSEFSDKVDFSLKFSVAGCRTTRKGTSIRRVAVLVAHDLFHSFVSDLLMMSRIFENTSGGNGQSAQYKNDRCGRAWPIWICSACFILGSANGCSTLLGKTKGPLDNLDTTGLKQAGYTFGEYGAHKPITTEDGTPAIVLEVISGKRHFEKIPLIQGQSLFIADLIRDAKLEKKIGRLNATILRPNGANRPPIRMDVDFDDSGKRVMEGQNYSLRAGDHVVVSHDERNMLSNMIPSMPFLKR